MQFPNARWPAAVRPVAAGQDPAPRSSRLPAVPTHIYAIRLGNLLSILSTAFVSFFAFFSGLPLKVSCAMPRQTRWWEPVW